MATFSVALVSISMEEMRVYEVNALDSTDAFSIALAKDKNEYPDRPWTDGAYHVFRGVGTGTWG